MTGALKPVLSDIVCPASILCLGKLDIILYTIYCIFSASFFSLFESLFCRLPARRLTCANSRKNLAADHEQSLKMWEGGWGVEVKFLPVPVFLRSNRIFSAEALLKAAQDKHSRHSKQFDQHLYYILAVSRQDHCSDPAWKFSTLHPKQI